MFLCAYNAKRVLKRSSSNFEEEEKSESKQWHNIIQCRYEWQIVEAPLKLMRCNGWMVVFDNQLKYCCCFFLFLYFADAFIELGENKEAKKNCSFVCLTCDSIFVLVFTKYTAEVYSLVFILPQLFRYECINMHICNQFHWMQCKSGSILFEKHAPHHLCAESVRCFLTLEILL